MSLKNYMTYILSSVSMIMIVSCSGTSTTGSQPSSSGTPSTSKTEGSQSSPDTPSTPTTGGDSRPSSSFDSPSVVVNDLESALSSGKKLQYVFVYNGFSGTSDQYGQPADLISDLSAENLSNLYWLPYYKESIGTKSQPSTSTPQDYKITLASGLEINTGPTLLSPNLALNSLDPGIVQLKTSLIKPIVLMIPSYDRTIPETPFFPSGTSYSAVIIESTDTQNNNPIISLEASSTNPVTFGVFSPYDASHPLRLRWYDTSSVLDASTLGQNAPLLTPAELSGVIKGRFLSLTSNGLPKLSLQSMDATTFKNLGLNSQDVLNLLPLAFPTQLTSMMTALNNQNYGIFSLGGNNQFDTVTLSDQTFIYPRSAPLNNAPITTISTVDVDNTSGFILERGTSLKVDTLTAQDTLKLLLMLNQDATQDATPILQIDHVKGTPTIQLTAFQTKDPKEQRFSTPIRLVSFNNNTNFQVQSDGVNQNGIVYLADVETTDTAINLKGINPQQLSGSLSSGAIRPLLNHPNTQGISETALRNMADHIHPTSYISAELRTLSGLDMSHTLAQMNDMASPCPGLNASFSNITFNPWMNISTHHRHLLDVVSVNVKLCDQPFFKMDASAYGAVHHKKSSLMGVKVSAYHHLSLGPLTVTPNLTLGYDTYHIDDVTLHHEILDLHLHDVSLRSPFARCSGTLNYKDSAKRLAISFGIEQRFPWVTRGTAIADPIRISLTDNDPLQSTTGMILDATLYHHNGWYVTADMWNFKAFKLMLGCVK